MNHWLFKTEPDTYSIDDLAREGLAPWDGVRNYQARNRLRDEVKAGDTVLVYHSSCAVPAVVGLAEVAGSPRPDPSQFDSGSGSYDPRSTQDAPRWFLVDLRFLERFPSPLSLKAIKQMPALGEMELVNRSRLSIQRVSEPAFALICHHCRAPMHQ